MFIVLQCLSSCRPFHLVVSFCSRILCIVHPPLFSPGRQISLPVVPFVPRSKAGRVCVCSLSAAERHHRPCEGDKEAEPPEQRLRCYSHSPVTDDHNLIWTFFLTREVTRCVHALIKDWYKTLIKKKKIVKKIKSFNSISFVLGVKKWMTKKWRLNIAPSSVRRKVDIVFRYRNGRHSVKLTGQVATLRRGQASSSRANTSTRKLFGWNVNCLTPALTERPLVLSASLCKA